MGLMLLVDTIRLLQPTTVIQLQSRYGRKNFPYPLSPDMVGRSRDSWRSAKAKLVYNLLELTAVPESNMAKDMRSQDLWGQPNPKVLRDIVMLSWLGQTAWPWPVYRISMASLTMGVTNSKMTPGNMLAAVNNQLVDLCCVTGKERSAPRDRPELYSVLSKNNICKPSLGVGFVRNIDTSNYIIFLSTYLAPEALAEVNCLLLGQLQMPGSVLLENVKTSAPYVAKKTYNPLDGEWQRYHKPRGSN